MQQRLHWTTLGALVCEDCEAAAAGTGHDGDPYVITHAPGCRFASEASLPPPVGRHRKTPEPAC